MVLQSVINSLPLRKIQAVFADFDNVGDEPEIVAEIIAQAIPELDLELSLILNQFILAWMNADSGGLLLERSK